MGCASRERDAIMHIQEWRERVLPIPSLISRNRGTPRYRSSSCFECASCYYHFSRYHSHYEYLLTIYPCWINQVYNDLFDHIHSIEPLMYL